MILFNSSFESLRFIFFPQAAPLNIVVGSNVWNEDPVLAWIDGQVSKIDGDLVHVLTTSGHTVPSLFHSLIMFINAFNVY